MACSPFVFNEVTHLGNHRVTPHVHTYDMDTNTQPQLLLIIDDAPEPTHWRLDEETREIGRQGLAKARAALRSARPTHLDLAA